MAKLATTGSRFRCHPTIEVGGQTGAPSFELETAFVIGTDELSTAFIFTKSCLVVDAPSRGPNRYNISSRSTVYPWLAAAPNHSLFWISFRMALIILTGLPKKKASGKLLQGSGHHMLQKLLQNLNLLQ